jgi:nucleoside-diphosphate-sugar epimerase
MRLAGIYGPGRGHWFKQFLRGEARLEGEGSRLLNMIHRDDVVGAIIAALQGGVPFPSVFNVVDNEPVSQRDFFAWLARQLGKPMPPSVPADVEANRKRGVTNKRVSNQRLRKMLGYQFKYPTFREGYAKEIEQMDLS